MPSELVLKSLKHLTPRKERSVYDCPELGAIVYKTGGEGWLIDITEVRDAQISVRPTTGGLGLLEADRFIGAILETPVPHAKLRKADSGNWCYDPWRMVIEVDAYNPAWGNTFKGGYRLANGHFDLYLNRLRNFRAFLTALTERQGSSS